MGDPKVVGWVGTGVMGCSMVHRLLAAGFAMRITSRTRARAADLETGGAVWVQNPAALVAECDAIITMVGYPRDVEEVYFGPAGIFSAGEKGSLELVIDMTTSSPGLAQKIARAATERGIGALDAPVSGGDIGARNGTLSIMVGGDEAAFQSAQGLFAPLAKTIRRQGDAGAGQHTKMVNQILIAGVMLGVCEGLLYAERAGLDCARVVASVAGGAAGSWTVDQLVPRMLRGDFAPGFVVDHFVKDMGIALEEAERRGLNLEGLAVARRLYDLLREQGHGRAGTHALLLGLRALHPE